MSLVRSFARTTISSLCSGTASASLGIKFLSCPLVRLAASSKCKRCWLSAPYKFKYICLTSGSCPSAKPLKLTSPFSAAPTCMWASFAEANLNMDRGRSVNAHMCWCQSGPTQFSYPIEVTPSFQAHIPQLTTCMAAN